MIRHQTISVLTELLNDHAPVPAFADLLEEARLREAGDLFLAKREAEITRWHRERRDEPLAYSI